MLFSIARFSTLRDYQLECIQVSLKKFTQGINRQVVSLPVGSGKTVTFANLIKRFKSPKVGAYKTLVIAHRKELLKQAYNQILNVSPDLIVQFDHGIQKPSVDCDVVLSSVQTLGRLNESRMQGYDPNEFKCIIIDEAHHAAADTYKRILKKFNALDDDSHLLIWGCSATVRRNDRKPLGQIFQEIVFERNFVEMIELKWLSNFSLYSVQTTCDLTRVRSTSSDFVTTELATKVNNVDRNTLVADMYLNLIENTSLKSTLVFAVDKKHIRDLVSLFRSKGVDARGIYSGLASSVRNQILLDFEQGKFPVLVNCAILTEGVDIPCIDSVLLARPTKSSILLQQMIGRGLRLHSGKSECLIVDFVDNLNESTNLATVPTLLGLPPKFNFQGLDVLSVVSKTKDLNLSQLMDTTNPDDIDSIPSQALPQDDIEVMFSPFTAPMNPETLDRDYNELKELTEHSWVRITHRSVALSMPESNSLLVTKAESFNYNVYHRYPLKWIAKEDQELYTLPTKMSLISKHESFTDALRAADEFALRKCRGWKIHIIKRSAKWRSKPATDKQISFLKKIGAVKPNVYDTELMKPFEVGDSQDLEINKGLAADLITRFKHGAISSAQKQLKLDKKQEKMIEAWRHQTRSTLN